MSTGVWDWGCGKYDGLHDDKPASPEERLFMAVVESAVHDYRLILRSVINQRKVHGRHHPGWMRNFNKLKYEMSTEWFAEICGYIGVHHTRVLAQMEKDRVAAGLVEVY